MSDAPYSIAGLTDIPHARTVTSSAANLTRRLRKMTGATVRSKPVSPLAMPFGIALALCLVVAGATTGRTLAQDATPGTFCAVLSADEVSDAMYTTFVTSKGTDSACEWDVVPGEQGDLNLRRLPVGRGGARQVFRHRAGLP